MPRTAAGALLALVLSLLVPGAGPAAPSEGVTRTPLPVILVHGYSDKKVGCNGINLGPLWDGAIEELTEYVGVPAADVVPVSFYPCDTGGVDMTGYGPGTSYPMVTTDDRLRAGHSTDDSITLLARDLAWFIYNEFNVEGRPVRVVGHSLGGLVIREALRRVQARDPRFPRWLKVRTVLTISTPHAGWAKECTSNTQCAEMTPGSQFLKDLRTNPAPQGVRGTQWWAMATEGGMAGGNGAMPCDAIPVSSATAVAGTALVYRDPCYRHCQYLNDLDQRQDAGGSAALEGRHSLAMMGHLLH